MIRAVILSLLLAGCIPTESQQADQYGKIVRICADNSPIYIYNGKYWRWYNGWLRPFEEGTTIEKTCR